jgi:hypothetical protein
MMYCVTSPAWVRHVLSHYHIVKGVVMSYFVTPSHCKWSMVWYRSVGSPHRCSRAYEWSTGPMLHCVRMSTRFTCLNDAACPHVLQCLSSEGALVTREHAWERASLAACLGQLSTGHMTVSKPSQARRHGPETQTQDTWKRRSPPEQGGGVQSRKTRDSTGALSSREAGSRVTRHVTAPKPSRSGRQSLKPRGTWQCRNPPEQ